MFKEFVDENFHRQSITSKSTKPRIEFIDLAKGICILLVVLVHHKIGASIPMLTALRMPLYFVLSGLFFKEYSGFIHFLIMKINRLIIPFCFFMGLYMLVELPRISLHGIINTFKTPFIEPVVANIPIWFLLCLFFVNLFYYVLHTRINNMTVKALVVAFLGIIGVVLGYYDTYLPLFIGNAFSATPFFFVGIVLRKMPILYESKHDGALYILAVVLLVATFTYCALQGDPAFIARLNYFKGNPIEIYIVSIVAVVGFLLLCKALKWMPILSYIGRYSIIVLGLHVIFRDYGYVVIEKTIHYQIANWQAFVLSFILSWILIPVFRKFFPKFTAQDNLISPKTHIGIKGNNDNMQI